MRVLATAAALATAVAIAVPALAAPPEPYPAGSPANGVYALLFGDDPEPFRPKAGERRVAWQDILFAAEPDPAKVSALARDPKTESRVRALAFNWLHAHQKPVPHGEVLGVIVEVPLKEGQDTLAAYADGSVRYINGSGGRVLIEPGMAPEISGSALKLVDLSTPVVAKISPMETPRQAPPKAPNARITFVVSDGLYFAEGPFGALQQHPATGPLLGQASNLMVKVLDATARK